MRNHEELQAIANQINLDELMQDTSDDELGTREFLSHIIREHNVTFEFARDVLYLLLSDGKVELTNRLKVKKKAATV